MSTRNTNDPGSETAQKSKWLLIDDYVRELKEEPWQTYWREMGPTEAMEFLSSPKDVLIKDGLIGEDYRIQTQIINAEVQAAIPSTCCGLIVFPTEKLALITVYRHPPH